jgi:predicted ATPase
LGNARLRDKKEKVMIGEKVRHYEGKNTDLAALKGKIEEYLQGDGFKVQSSVPSPHGTLIQVQKGGFLSAVIAADRAFNILINGEPDNFTVRVGIGKWLEHLGVTAVETLLLSELFLLVDVSEMLWNLDVENKIVKQVDSIVG